MGFEGYSIPKHLKLVFIIIHLIAWYAEVYQERNGASSVIKEQRATALSCSLLR